MLIPSLPMSLIEGARSQRSANGDSRNRKERHAMFQNPVPPHWKNAVDASVKKHEAHRPRFARRNEIGYGCQLSDSMRADTATENPVVTRPVVAVVSQSRYPDCGLVRGGSLKQELRGDVVVRCGELSSVQKDDKINYALKIGVQKQLRRARLENPLPRLPGTEGLLSH
jgi:hypothetical protein